MADPGADDPPIPQAMLDAAGIVGSWTHDHWAGTLMLSAPLATLLGLDPAVAATGLPLADFLDRTHPEDRTRIESYLHAVGEAGGPLEAEFRAGGRRLLMRGRIERDAAGRSDRAGASRSISPRPRRPASIRPSGPSTAWPSTPSPCATSPRPCAGPTSPPGSRG